MKALTEAVANLLYEIHDSPDLTPASRARVAQWLARGQEWDLVEMLEELLQIEEAGITASQSMTHLAFELDTEPVPQVQERFFRDVPLPPGLTNEHLREAMNQTQWMIIRINRSLRFGTGLPLINFIQANSFSGIISNILTDSLDQISPYKHNHDQRFPDLGNPLNGVGLEMKASTSRGREVKATMDTVDGTWCPVLNWTRCRGIFYSYTSKWPNWLDMLMNRKGTGIIAAQQSTRRQAVGEQRLTTRLAVERKLRDGSVYLDTDRVANWKRWRHDKSYPIPPHSPLYFQRIDNRAKAPSPRNPDRLVSWSTVKNHLNDLDQLWSL